jgi:LacI family transcriptional regulator
MSQRSRRSSSAVTISDVAARAGVSAMTVSNVLGGRKRVLDATRDAVHKAIEELGYTPNAAARALASASQLRVGLIYRNPQSAFLSAVLVGALNASAQLGAQLLIRSCEAETAEATAATLQSLIRSGANALLLPPPFCEIIDRSPELRTSNVPMMALSSGRELANMPGVRIDDYEAARAMTARLIELGHRRIALIEGPAHHYASATRLAGFQAAMREVGIRDEQMLIAKGDFTYDSGLIAAQRLLDLPRRPTAIFAFNDDIAAAVVSEAHRRGILVPDELSIVGFDDTPIAVKIWPPLTTVRQPIVEISELATQRLVEALRQPQDDGGGNTTVHVPFSIVERESTSSPPKISA